MLRRVSLLGLILEPLGSLLWVLFIVWTACVGFLWATGFGEPQLDALVPNVGLRRSLVLLCKLADAIWIGLAAACAYLCVADTHGISLARRWTLTVFALVGVVVIASVATKWPLGPVFYSQRLGVKLGPVPLGVPLLWLVIVFGGRALWMRLFRRASHTAIAVGTGSCAVLTAWNLESLASRARGWWFWYEPATRAAIPAPVQNYVSWFLVATAIAFLLREPRVIGAPPEQSDKLIAILGLLNIVCLVAHLAALLHR
jgi:uncharacterized membrane protein